MSLPKYGAEGTIYVDTDLDMVYIACGGQWLPISNTQMFRDELTLELASARETPYEAIKSIVEGR